MKRPLLPLLLFWPWPLWAENPPAQKEIYTIERGDTLSDIADQLLGNVSYWPKLWSLNPHIKNPHVLEPGTQIQIYSKDMGIAESSELQTSEELERDETQVHLEDLIVERLEIKDPSYQSRRTEIISREDLKYQKELFLMAGHVFDADSLPLNLPGFLLEEKPETLCEILSGTSGEEATTQDQEFICDPEKDDLPLDTQLTVLRKRETLSGKNHPDLYRYDFVAQVRLTQDLDDKDYFLGQVTESALALEKGDLVVTYRSTRRSLDASSEEEPKASPNPAQIIGFEEETQEYAGVGDLVFLNRGNTDGFEEGQKYPIHRFMHSLVENGVLSQYPKQMTLSGEVWIVDSSGSASVGYIKKQNQEIALGDVVGF